MNTHPSQLGDLPLAPPLENTQPFFMTPPEVQTTVPFVEPHATGLGDWMSSAEFAISQNEGALPTWPSALQRMMGGVLDGTQEDWNQSQTCSRRSGLRTSEANGVYHRCM